MTSMGDGLAVCKEESKQIPTHEARFDKITIFVHVYQFKLITRARVLIHIRIIAQQVATFHRTTDNPLEARDQSKKQIINKTKAKKTTKSMLKKNSNFARNIHFQISHKTG